MKRLALIVSAAALLALPSVSQAASVRGGIYCSWSGCNSYTTLTPWYANTSNVDGLGCDNLYNTDNGAWLEGVYCDDTLANLSTVVAQECDLWQVYGPTIRRVILVGRAQGDTTSSYTCDSTDAPYSYSVTVAESYPYWDTGHDGDECSGCTATDDEQQYQFNNSSEFACNRWGWMSQATDFGWPAGQFGSWTNPPPTASQAQTEWNYYNQNCYEYNHVYTLSDGSNGTGVEAQY